MIVCLCKVVSDREIKDLVCQGSTTVKRITQACGAGSVCGACRVTVHSLIEANKRCPSQSSGSSPSLGLGLGLQTT